MSCERMSGYEAKARARFWSKVNRDAGVTGCWIWVAGRSNTGYGSFVYRGRVENAHRLAYEWLFGPPPDGLQLDHLCRNRPCVNPTHLEAVTQAENLRRGSTTRLTSEDREEIRSSTDQHTVLAARYGVHPSTVLRVRSGELWKDAA